MDIEKKGAVMNLPEDTHLAYVMSHEAWYWNTTRTPGEHPHLSVSASAKGSGGGVAWEFDVEEMELGGKPCTRVKMFDDSYEAFAQVPELFAALADGAGPTLKAVRTLLDMLGAVDETERVSPYADEAPQPQPGHDETVREALRLAMSVARESQTERFAAALAAMDGEG